MIIDAHMHLAESCGFSAKTYGRYGMSFPKETTDVDFLVESYRKAGITKAVAMGQAMRRIFDTSFGEEYVMACYEKHPDFFIPFCSVEAVDKSGRFNKKDYEYLKSAVLEHGCRGVLMAPPFSHYHSNVNAAYPFYEFADEHGIVVQFHHSAQIGKAILAPAEYTSLYDLNEIILDFPNLRINVEHLGYPWAEQLFTQMATDENLFTDLAMCYDRKISTVWNLVLAKEYGVIGQVMFATDFVACNFDCFGPDPGADVSRWITYVTSEINQICRASGWTEFTEEELDGILYKNAARLHKIVE